MNERIQIWLDALTRQYNQSQANMVRSMGSNIVPSRIIYFKVEGDKYYKIWYNIEHVDPSAFNGRLIGNREPRVVHAFVDKVTGDVYKPATRRGPAKHVRYNLLNDESFNNMIEKCDWSGGYLYIK